MFYITINKKGFPEGNRKLTSLPKWKRLLKGVWDNIKNQVKVELTGSGILDTAVKLIKKHDEAKRKEKGKGNKSKTVFLSSDPEKLADRLTLLCGSAQAGNTGLKNEMVEICNELIRMKAMTRKQRDQLLYDV